MLIESSYDTFMNQHGASHDSLFRLAVLAPAS